MTDEWLLVQTSLESDTDADTMATALIEARLAVCVQIAGPVRSVYRWHGRIERQQEFVLSAKVHRGSYPEVAAWLEAHHPYDVPEMIAVPVCRIGAAYLNWALGEMR